MSLRTRLLLALVTAALIGLAIVDVLTYTLVTQAQLDQVDQELERAHPPIERAASDPSPDRARAIREAAPGFFVELRSFDETVLLTVPLMRPGEEAMLIDGVDLPQPSGSSGDDEAVFASVRSSGDHDLRVRVSRQPEGGILIIGRSMQLMDETRERLLVALLMASAGAVVAVGLIGASLVHIGLRPLVAVERAAGEITDSDLDRRVPGDERATEVGRLALAINTMLARLHRAFEQREEDLIALQESEARMRRFVADASHELRTPIAATAAYAELFERGARDHPADLERAMSGIRSETARMSELVEDLLLLAQLDEGRPLAQAPVDLAAVVLEAVGAARAVAPERPINVRIDDVVTVTGDASRLRQVMDNLLGNVLRHTPTGTPCTVEIRRDDDDAVLTVADEGPGMPANDAARAFDRFHRADTSRTRASGGAGLGLSIAAAIVAAHSGTISMSSQLDHGTTVTVRLPTTRSSEVAETRIEGVP